MSDGGTHAICSWACVRKHYQKSCWHFVCIVGISDLFTVAPLQTIAILLFATMKIKSVSMLCHVCLPQKPSDLRFFTQIESFQPLWSEGIGTMPALCPAWMPCPGARRRWHERNPELQRKTQGIHLGAHRVASWWNKLNVHTTSIQLCHNSGLFEFLNYSTLCFTFYAANILVTGSRE